MTCFSSDGQRQARGPKGRLTHATGRGWERRKSWFGSDVASWNRFQGVQSSSWRHLSSRGDLHSTPWRRSHSATTIRAPAKTKLKTRRCRAHAWDQSSVHKPTLHYTDGPEFATTSARKTASAKSVQEKQKRAPKPSSPKHFQNSNVRWTQLKSCPEIPTKLNKQMKTRFGSPSTLTASCYL